MRTKKKEPVKGDGNCRISGKGKKKEPERKQEKVQEFTKEAPEGCKGEIKDDEELYILEDNGNCMMMGAAAEIFNDEIYGIALRKSVNKEIIKNI